MMKKIKLIILLSSILLGLISVSCSNEEITEEKDERFVGAWELEESQSHINFNIEAGDPNYYKQILNTMVMKDGVLDNYIFGDTIQFFEKGFFSEAGSLLQEDVWDSVVYYYPSYKVVAGQELFVNESINSSRPGNRRATYEFVGEDLLVLTVEYTDEFNLLRLNLELDGEYDHKVIRTLNVNQINYTQIYRKISSVPYRWE